MKFSLVLLMASVSAVSVNQLSSPVEPVANHCTNANKATGLDQDCSAAGQSAWNTISTSRTGDPTKAQAGPYPDHTLH